MKSFVICSPDQYYQGDQITKNGGQDMHYSWEKQKLPLPTTQGWRQPEFNMYPYIGKCPKKMLPQNYATHFVCTLP